MQQLIYASRPFGYDSASLAGILSVARVRNPQLNITGALVCRSDIFLQLLEGPTGQVETLYEKITQDDRHVEVAVLVRCRVEDRLFPNWAMRHDPAHTWLWSREEVAAGVLHKARPRDVRSVFVKLANTPVSQDF